MNRIAQIVVVTLMNLRNIPQRLGASVAATVGVAGVVVVMVTVLSIAVGFRTTLETTGSPDTAIVMRSGSNTEMNSVLMGEDVRIIADAPGIVRLSEGPAASPELFVILDLPKRSTGTAANVPLRGVEAAAFDVREEVEIAEGRRFEPGRNEVIAGVGAAGQFEGLEVGNTLRAGNTEWDVVGIFSADGTLAESEIWCDARVLQPAYMRGNSFQVVYAKLESPERFEGFKQALEGDPRLDVSVIRETEYYAGQARWIYLTVMALGLPVTALMAVGAVFGAVNTMYSAVAARTREIATLRALGFGGGAVALSVLVESLCLAVVGGLAGGLGAYLVFDGYRAATMNWESFSQVAFAFNVTAGLVTGGVVLAVAIGLLGGVFPAVRAARLPVATALREL